MDNREYRRARVFITGAVQGVGFRPFVYRLATDMQLTGWVNNSSAGVTVEIEGDAAALHTFIRRIEADKPPASFIQSLDVTWLDPAGYTDFTIHESDPSGEKTAIILPDFATCPDCQREIFDPANRRYRYPFTNCTNCGPRFSIITALPYDRPNTTMAAFEMCDECRAEYENPLDRRFHAQPNACPKCGPHLGWWGADGKVLATHREALLAAAAAIRGGEIVAVKGLGGFHLMCDARNDDAVTRLRERKRREEKPFALMFPSLYIVRAVCDVSELEAALLTSPQAPIVLLQRNHNVGTRYIVSLHVAPNNPYRGVMLPYTPLHHLLLAELGFPVVATSGNLSDEPICTDEREAVERLRGLADAFLVHNRPIERHVDDSIVRMVGGREMVMRRARGYAPLPIRLREPVKPLVAVGAHLKNTAAVARGKDVFISQHIGDLETEPAFDAFRRVIASLQQAYELQPEAIAHDLHPDYLSTQYARATGLPLIGVQHHYAHVLACMADNELGAPVLGVSWDGTGYGTDGTIWGGEFLRVDERGFDRFAHLRTFRLPGSDVAVKEPRRAALGLLYEIYGDAVFDRHDLAPVKAFTSAEMNVLRGMLRRGLNAPVTSSAGRLFDAAASLIGLRQRCSFEGQAAMELEFTLNGVSINDTYHCELRGDSPIVIEYQPFIEGLIADAGAGVPVGVMSAKFHNTLVENIVAVAQRAGIERVALTGGCFQNVYLTERAISRLRESGFTPYWHRRVPPNDGGIALGQVVGV
ncbi:MAG: carbamoyltransferase HypF [Chloroflexi bacterium]|nr:carbamoyltransferase HypF [Chloroflexota bacterium]